ncbi:MAG: hypothetical protein AVDCRST_MAG73-2357 [uncultured Thermomicrobiales bacterium]|uniref:Uncharacterized protein n=1 Tax=uncultured Thermomicrobiales bacterium TaxID=1645740 RepID=A0A6J4UD86_9BACT|nr:MAG: hypothetical protein AVDCRST_MAG73-2357 [uncultured Thermomicrobiales bacterium]
MVFDGVGGKPSPWRYAPPLSRARARGRECPSGGRIDAPREYSRVSQPRPLARARERGGA